jgi:hypothetical protein
VVEPDLLFGGTVNGDTPRAYGWLARRARQLTVFALLGTLLHALDRASPPAPDARPILVVDVAAGSDPATIERAIEEAVLVDAALELGLPWSDPFVRARLVTDIRASDPDAVAASDEAILQRARQLDLLRAHPVVRARVAEAMRRRIEHGEAIAPPTDAELEAYLRAHADRYARPPSLDFRHVFLSAARRGNALDTDARDLAARLVDARLDDADGLGDPSLLVRDRVAATPASIDAAFGPGTGEAIAAAEPGRWVGPIRGAYGAHVVFVRAHRPGGLPALAEVEDRVRADLLADLRRAARERGVQALRAKVRVAVREVEASP